VVEPGGHKGFTLIELQINLSYYSWNLCPDGEGWRKVSLLLAEARSMTAFPYSDEVSIRHRCCLFIGQTCLRLYLRMWYKGVAVTTNSSISKPAFGGQVRRRQL
jgi:hypothetical protein